MVQSIIDIGNNEDRILNMVKAKYGFKNKSQAIALILQMHGENFLEPELRPEFVEKMKRIDKEEGIPFKDIDELRRLTGE